jgi:hypothetical protein
VILHLFFEIKRDKLFFFLNFRSKLIKLTEMENIQMETLDPTFKGSVFTYLSIVLYSNAMNRNNFTLQICKETLLTNQIVFYFTKNFYLVHKFNELISSFKSAGIVDYFISKYIDVTLTPLKSTTQHPTKLTLENLKGIFQLLIYGLSISLGCFVIEILIWNLKKWRKYFR